MMILEHKRPPSDRYDTSAVRGDVMLLRLWRAGRPKVTKSWGRYCSGGVSIRSLLRIGSKVDEIFSLSSDEYVPEKGSLLNDGVVGVMGMSSEMSEAVVVALAGVVMADDDERLGVTGRDGRDR